MGLFTSKADGCLTRLAWGAEDPLAKVPLHHPVADVYVTAVESQTYLKNVFHPYECYKFLRELQKVEMFDEGLPDIAYNFYVGGTGDVYEGRGWFFAPTLKEKGNQENTKAIAIAFIRPIPGTLPTEKMVSKVEELISYGVKSGYINNIYSIIG